MRSHKRSTNRCRQRRDGALSSASRFTSSGPACLSSGRWASMRVRLLSVSAVLLLILSGCRSFSERYVAKHPNLDPQTRDAILKHRVILGMSPDEAIAATSGHRQPYASAVNPDTGVVIDINFWTRTQFGTTNLVGFKVVFTKGRAASITRLPKWKDAQ